MHIRQRFAGITHRNAPIKSLRGLYLQIYFNGENALEHQHNFNAMMDMLELELKTGNREQEHEKVYTKYFDITTTTVRGSKLTVKEDAIRAAEKNYGFFALLSSEIEDSIQALEIYRNKDLVEKTFGNLKERLNLHRTAVSSDTSLDGKLFVQFYSTHISFLS